METFHGTTIVAVRRDNKVALGGDGQGRIEDVLGNESVVKRFPHRLPLQALHPLDAGLTAAAICAACFTAYQGLGLLPVLLLAAAYRRCLRIGLAIAGFVLGTLLDANPNSNSKEILIVAIDTFTSGAVIGFTFASMLLGHWYLNTPTMKLDPLKRLLVGLGVAIVARMLFCAVGVAYQFVQPAAPDLFVIGAICLRWLAGLVGLLIMTIMSWQTLKIPNTQSATGILYVGVIFVFIGELASRLLSVQSSFPL